MVFFRCWMMTLCLGFSGTAAAREAILIHFGAAQAASSTNTSRGSVEAALRLVWDQEVPSQEPARTAMITPEVWLPLPENSRVTTAHGLGTRTLPCIAPSYRPTPWLAPQTEQRRALFYREMAKIACETGLPVALLDATVTHESAYNPWARSSAGAMGMMQLMPATARALGLANPWHPLANLRAGARYLRQQLDRFGRFDLALAAYNAGPERKSLIAGSIPRIPETIGYVRAITSNWVRMTQLASIQPGSERRYLAASDAVQRAGYRETSLLQFVGPNLASAN